MNKFEFLSMDTIDDKGEATGDNLSDGGALAINHGV